VGTKFRQVDWSDEVANSARTLVHLAIQEDLADQQDWTTTALVPPEAIAAARMVPREPGVLAGGPVISIVLQEMQADLEVTDLLDDGAPVVLGQPVACLKGSARDLLTCERIILNFLSRLSGIASLTRQFVDTVAGTSAEIYDTRKTTPGWRLLEKYAVRCGGGRNHRLGLYAAVMMKDNHIALAHDEGLTLEKGLQRVRDAIQEQQASLDVFEVEVDTLEQLEALLPSQPDILLLDNMPPESLRQAVKLRDRLAPAVTLEASGGVHLQSIGDIADTGVDRISVGGLTHSAGILDFGFDWGAVSGPSRAASPGEAIE